MLSFMYFIDLLFPPRPDELVVRTLSVENISALLDPKLATLTCPETIVLFSFVNPAVRSLIHEAKYHGNTNAFTMLAHGLLAYLGTNSLHNPIIVPIPLSGARRRKRGFNQIEEIARLAATRTPIPVNTHILKRIRDTAPQTTLSRSERERNMRHAFIATSTIDSKHTYIIVDDVITTGATLQAAINAMKKKGATRIIPLALAH